MPQLLTLSGSLRAGSTNAAILEAVPLIAPEGLTVSAYGGLEALPAFNPDIEEGADRLPEAVRDWRAALGSADTVLISTPEYAHGMPGALKNALDWVVGGSEIVGKPVGVINVSAASRFAFPQLVEVLTVMSATVVPGATVIIDLPRRGVTAEGLAVDPKVVSALKAVIAALLAAR